jgi:hypothetical protein
VWCANTRYVIGVTAIVITSSLGCDLNSMTTHLHHVCQVVDEDRHKNDKGSISGDSTFIIGYILCPIFNFTPTFSRILTQDTVLDILSKEKKKKRVR